MPICQICHLAPFSCHSGLSLYILFFQGTSTALGAIVASGIIAAKQSNTRIHELASIAKQEYLDSLPFKNSSKFNSENAKEFLEKPLVQLKRDYPTLGYSDNDKPLD